MVFLKSEVMINFKLIHVCMCARAQDGYGLCVYACEKKIF